MKVIQSAITNSSTSAFVVWWVQSGVSFSSSEAGWFAYRLFGGDRVRLVGTFKTEFLEGLLPPTPVLITEWGDISYVPGEISFRLNEMTVPASLLPYTLHQGSIYGEIGERTWCVTHGPSIRGMDGTTVILETDDTLQGVDLTHLANTFEMIGAKSEWVMAIMQAQPSRDWKSAALSHQELLGTPMVVEENYVFWPLSISPLVMVAFTPVMVRYEDDEEDDRIWREISDGFMRLHQLIIGRRQGAHFL